jgi:hypothetical protein
MGTYRFFMIPLHDSSSSSGRDSTPPFIVYDAGDVD